MPSSLLPPYGGSRTKLGLFTPGEPTGTGERGVTTDKASPRNSCDMSHHGPDRLTRAPRPAGKLCRLFQDGRVSSRFGDRRGGDSPGPRGRAAPSRHPAGVVVGAREITIRRAPPRRRQVSFPGCSGGLDGPPRRVVSAAERPARMTAKLHPAGGGGTSLPSSPSPRRASRPRRFREKRGTGSREESKSGRESRPVTTQGAGSLEEARVPGRRDGDDEDGPRPRPGQPPTSIRLPPGSTGGTPAEDPTSSPEREWREPRASGSGCDNQQSEIGHERGPWHGEERKLWSVKRSNRLPSPCNFSIHRGRRDPSRMGGTRKITVGRCKRKSRIDETIRRTWVEKEYPRTSESFKGEFDVHE
ncbi:hypothetical protein THAOC_24173 [Thalassiosira oceanica]|uniref:Uncharacterized protein n=1 Tax=Thalassiosira oceanica TaxID=159749 RepID=K0RUB4_THAOC|nr:hypothetical protein THAOC_24173 [Thalassiosira oceanica]|eukprot:EJK56014.1 hypothetical protein THAOC_24173 [Thalassiosira oceanica]